MVNLFGVYNMKNLIKIFIFIFITINLSGNIVFAQKNSLKKNTVKETNHKEVIVKPKTIDEASPITKTISKNIHKTVMEIVELEQSYEEQIHQNKMNLNTIKIVSLAPNITENLFSLGLGANIVGVDALSDYPKQATKIPKIATINSIDYEEIIKLKPDLIVVWNNFYPDLKKKLKEYKIPAQIFRFRVERLSDYSSAIIELGKRTHTEDKAIKIKELFQKQMRDLKNKYQNYPTHSVVYVLWDSPIYTVSEKSWINDILEICNSKNPFKSNDLSYPIIDREFLLATNPDMLINATVSNDKLDIPAILQNKVVTQTHVDGMLRITTRTYESSKELCELIHKNDLLINESEINTNIEDEIYKDIVDQNKK